MSDITNKLLAIIHDTIDNIKTINLYGDTMFSTEPPYIKVAYNNLYGGSRFGYNPTIARSLSYWDGDKEVSKLEYGLELPDHIKENAEKKAEPITITLELGSKPPIEIKREYIDSHVGEGRYYNLPYWLWTKRRWIFIKYIQSVPKYSITSGTINVNIDEKTFDNIRNKILDKKAILDNLELTKQQDKDLEILEGRYNLIESIKQFNARLKKY